MLTARGIVRRIVRHGDAPAVLDGGAGGAVSYAAINASAAALAAALAPHVAAAWRRGGRQPTVAYLHGRDREYVAAQCGTWLSGAIGVPLAESYPPAEYEYLLRDSGAAAVVTSARLAPTIQGVADALGIPVLHSAPVDARATFDPAGVALVGPAAPGAAPDAGDGAMLIYTSGTTGRPKGVLVTHGMLEAQVGALTSAWGWSARDHILSVLPLHHVHGVVAVLNSALYSGAVVELLPRFDAAATWAALTRARGHAPQGPLTLLMAVPTVYAKLVDAFDRAPADTQAAWAAALRAPESPVRLMVSGSAALPDPLALRWREITGHTLLERYGMSEFSMALSNPLHGARKLNSVGRPLPGYRARIVPEAGEAGVGGGGGAGAGSAPDDGGDGGFAGPGELQIRGPGVFTQYWNRPDATAESFTPDGWFRTGDCAVRDADGCFSILGRLSADIIKSGGYKISALDVERVLLSHPAVGEAAVLGVADAVFGERVAAVLTLKSGATGEGSLASARGAGGLPPELFAGADSLQAFCAAHLPGYKLPSAVKCVADIPRNAMGKVNKKALRAALFPAAPA